MSLNDYYSSSDNSESAMIFDKAELKWLQKAGRQGKTESCTELDHIESLAVHNSVEQEEERMKYFSLSTTMINEFRRCEEHHYIFLEGLSTAGSSQ
ncbi:hypothetical protein MP638_005579 [Amoeboaphelidium occidentale]|nr:hypothetical protein MP638_005579 [Amoeboaphelidium occidentale]